MYLRVADRRLGAGPLPVPAFAASTPFGSEPLKAQRSTAVALIGLIRPATQTYNGECGPPSRPSARFGRAATATFYCPAGCRASLEAENRRGRQIKVARSFGALDPLLVPQTFLRLPAERLTGLGPGRIHLLAEVDGKPIARRNLEVVSRAQG
jgi:hypothetical protein